MGEIVFVGLGLQDERGISLRGLEEIKTADKAFIELYTNLMPSFSIESLEKNSGKKLHIVSREELEERSGESIIQAAETGKVVLLVPGDPLIATTHVALRIHAEKLAIRTRVVHGASIISAVIGLSGLHNYKFGKSVTIPLRSENLSDTPYDVIAQNKKLGLHTLCLLDVKVEEDRSMKIQEGLESLLQIEEKRKEKILTIDTLVVGIARAGSYDPTVKSGFLKDLLKYDFGDPPHSMIFPGKLHFMETEAIVVLGGAPENLREMVE